MAVIIPAVAGKVIHIGRAGENLATTVQFDVGDWIRDFGNSGTFNLYVQQGGNYTYPVTLDITQLSNGVVLWHVTENNTAMVGLGKCELAYTLAGSDASTTSDDLRVKSIIYDIAVTNSLDAEVNENPPDAIQSWLATVDSALTEATSGQQWATGGTGGTPSATNNAKYYSQQSERWAKGTQDGVAVSSGNGYHNNAKYWADQAADAADRVEGLDAGNVTTLAPGSAATVTRRTEEATGSTPEHYEFDFGIPRGATFWTTLTAPTSPNYTFTISDLSGPSTATPAIGDIILYSYYWYSISSVSTTTVLTTQRTSIRGATGATGSAAGFGTPTATIDANIGTPAVAITSSGTNTSKVFNFAFSNLKGEKGDTGHGLEITGHVTDSNGLTALSPQPAIGTVYSVGSTEPYELWIKESTGTALTTWRNLGKFGGARAELYTWS